MTDEVLVEEFRQPFGVVEHVRGCAQANAASKAKQIRNFPHFSLFSPLLAKGRLGKQSAYR